MTGRVQSILELPFHRRPVFEVLGFEPDRMHVDLEYTGVGWAVPTRLWLQGARAVELVEAPLVLALHSADDGRALADDVELHFALEPERAVAVLLSRFLERWLPRLPATQTIVLALCNPHRAAVQVPSGLGDRTLRYALGSVDSWLDLPGDHGGAVDGGLDRSVGALAGEDEREAGGRFRLVAEQWQTAVAAPARRRNPAGRGGAPGEDVRDA